MIPTKEILKMKAYHGDKKLKSLMVKEVKWHRDQDLIIQGTYGDSTKSGSKFCAVGCAIDSLNRKLGKNLPNQGHKHLEEELGIPEALTRLWDSLFEKLPKELAIDFPLEFIKAIPVGADLSLVAPKFIVFVLKDCLVNADDNGKKAINQTIGLWLKVIAGKDVKQAAWSAAESAAESAADSAADSAARSAAWSAAWSAARSAAWSAAGSAARSAADSAARSAAESAAWSATWSEARSAACGRYANKLIKLLKEAPVK
jgi:hypothetical protein